MIYYVQVKATKFCIGSSQEKRDFDGSVLQNETSLN